MRAAEAVAREGLAARRAPDARARRARRRLVLARNRPPRLDARAPDRAVQAPDDVRDPLAARRHRREPRAALPLEARPRPRRPAPQPGPALVDRRLVRGRRSRHHPRLVRADLLHRLDGRANPRRPAEPPLPPPAAALARLLLAQPRRGD